DCDRAFGYFANSPQGKLWSDEAMKPFRESFIKRFSEDVLGPLEKELGIKFSDYKDLARGQLTFALTQNGWAGKSDNQVGWLLLLYTKDKREQLKTRLIDLKRKWVETGQSVKMDKIRDAEFMTVIVDEKALNRAIEKAFPKSPV